jgi:hypothetical protein
VWEHLSVNPQDPEQRVAELEQQLAAAKATALFDQLRAGGGLGDYSAWLNPGGRQPVSSAGEYGAPLAPAPRRVPLRFVLAEILPFRWWYVFFLFMVAIPPIIVWIMLPEVFLPAAVVSLLGIYGFHVRGASTRLALLKWGQVATVTGTEMLSQATYFSGTTYSNVVLPIARGWQVTRPMWSGPKTKTRVRYVLEGQQGDLVVGGREYIDGVILADQRKPARALCVTAFPYDLDRDESGQWVGKLRIRLVIGMACWLLIMIGWIGLAAFLFSASKTAATTGVSSAPRTTVRIPAPSLIPEPGAAVLVSGANQYQSITCNLNPVTISGSADTVDITGHCLSVTVSGVNNHVTVDVADAITATGSHNVITFRAGAPEIDNVGMDNTILPG